MENKLEDNYKNRIAIDSTRPENSDKENSFLFQLENKKNLLLKELTQTQVTIKTIENNISDMREAMLSANLEPSPLSKTSRETLNTQFINYIESTIQNIKKLNSKIDLIEDKLHNVIEEIGIVSLKSDEYEPPEQGEVKCHKEFV